VKAEKFILSATSKSHTAGYFFTVSS